MVRRRRVHQRRRAVFAGGVHVGAGRDQHPRDCGVPGRRRNHQRRHPGVVERVDVGSARDQLLDDRGPTVEDGVRKRRRLRRSCRERGRGSESGGSDGEMHGSARTIPYGTVSKLQICG